MLTTIVLMLAIALMLYIAGWLIRVTLAVLMDAGRRDYFE